MKRINNIFMGLILGLIFGFWIYCLNSSLMIIPWPPPKNPFHFSFPVEVTRFLFANSLKFGVIPGVLIGVIFGSIYRKRDQIISEVGIFCWILSTIFSWITNWGLISGSWFIRAIIITPVSLFSTLLVYMVIFKIVDSHDNYKYL